MTHIPTGTIVRGGIFAEDDAMNLQRADTFLAGEHHVNDAEPVAKRLVGVFEDGSDEMREAIRPALPAVRAFPLPFHRFEGICLDTPAARADDTLGPAVSDEVRATGIFMRERPFELGDCHLMNDGFLDFHSPSVSLWEL